MITLIQKQETKRARMLRTRSIFDATDESRRIDYPVCLYCEQYERRFERIEARPAPAEPTEVKPTSVAEMLCRPRQSRFTGLVLTFTGDLRPYRTGLSRRVASDLIAQQGGRTRTDKHYKIGDFIVVGADRSIVDGQCKGIPAISAEEFLQLLDS